MATVTGLPVGNITSPTISTPPSRSSIPAKTGMWLFMASEIMMFGALFVGALLFHTLHHGGFAEGSAHLDWRFGAVNTLFLLTAGLTMGLSVVAAQAGEQGKVRMNLILSLVFAAGFLVVKSPRIRPEVRASGPCPAACGTLITASPTRSPTCSSAFISS